MSGLALQQGAVITKSPPDPYVTLFHFCLPAAITKCDLWLSNIKCYLQ